MMLVVGCSTEQPGRSAAAAAHRSIRCRASARPDRWTPARLGRAQARGQPDPLAALGHRIGPPLLAGPIARLSGRVARRRRVGGHLRAAPLAIGIIIALAWQANPFKRRALNLWALGPGVDVRSDTQPTARAALQRCECGGLHRRVLRRDAAPGAGGRRQPLADAGLPALLLLERRFPRRAFGRRLPLPRFAAVRGDLSSQPLIRQAAS